MYLHLYYNPEKQVDDAKNFTIKETPKRGISVTYNQDKIGAAHERYDFFILISNNDWRIPDYIVWNVGNPGFI